MGDSGQQRAAYNGNIRPNGTDIGVDVKKG